MSLKNVVLCEMCMRFHILTRCSEVNKDNQPTSLSTWSKPVYLGNMSKNEIDGKKKNFALFLTWNKHDIGLNGLES